jgi:hypothetical protein
MILEAWLQVVQSLALLPLGSAINRVLFSPSDVKMVAKASTNHLCDFALEATLPKEFPAI